VSKKNGPASVDSTGLAVGEGIKAHVRDDLSTFQGLSSLDWYEDIEFDVTSVQDEWWGPFGGDSEEDHQQRIQGFLTRLHAARDKVCIVVGHSHFFRSIFRECLQDNEKTKMLGIGASLRAHPLPYCGVVGLRFEWSNDAKGNIVEAVPLLSTNLLESKVRGEICCCSKGTGPGQGRTCGRGGVSWITC